MPTDTGKMALRHETDWDQYWLKAHGKKRSGLYEWCAEFYRAQIISRFGARILARHFPDEPTRHYLHAGCGSGGSDQRIRLTQPRFHVLDFSLAGLQMNRQRAMPIARQFLCGDLFFLPYRANTMDGIFNFGVMEHFDEPSLEKILAEFHRVLKPDGCLLLFWPPRFGLSVMVLSSFLWVVNTFRTHRLTLYPDEVSRVQSFTWVRELLRRNRFQVVNTYFGWRDLFTFVTVVAKRIEDEKSAMMRNGTSSLMRKPVSDAVCQ